MSETKDVRVKALQDAVDALRPAAEATGGHFTVALEKVQGLLDEAIAASPSGEEVVAWAVKDYADGWIVSQSEASARALAKNMGNTAYPLRITSPEAPQASEVVRELVEALEWYGEQSRLCRLIHSGGDAGRHALAADGGKRAKAALAKIGGGHE